MIVGAAGGTLSAFSAGMNELLAAHLASLRSYLGVLAMPERERPRGALAAAVEALDRTARLLPVAPSAKAQLRRQMT